MFRKQCTSGSHYKRSFQFYFTEYSHTVTVLQDQRNLRRKTHRCNANIYIYILPKNVHEIR